MIPLIFLIELICFLVRPFSLGLRLFVAMIAGHVLLEVLAGFVINGTQCRRAVGRAGGQPAQLHPDVGVSALELLVAGIQAYVFALLTSLYINDADNLH